MLEISSKEQSLHCNPNSVSSYAFQSDSHVFGSFYLQFQGIANVNCRPMKDRLQEVTIKMENIMVSGHAPTCSHSVGNRFSSANLVCTHPVVLCFSGV